MEIKVFDDNVNACGDTITVETGFDEFNLAALKCVLCNQLEHQREPFFTFTNKEISTNITVHMSRRYARNLIKNIESGVNRFIFRGQHATE